HKPPPAAAACPAKARFSDQLPDAMLSYRYSAWLIKPLPTSFNAGMSLQALMALLGHYPPR
ncbi:MAG: hypothetical protein ACRDOK_31100, partial [Streptosporangiaceae bacterium]